MKAIDASVAVLDLLLDGPMDRAMARLHAKPPRPAPAPAPAARTPSAAGTPDGGGATP